MEKTDQSLLLKLKQTGSNDAWRVFFECYSTAMLYYARKLKLDQTEAEEAVQEAMITMMRTLRNFNYDPGRGLFRNYVLTILHRRCLQILKNRKRQEVPLDDHVNGTAAEELWRKPPDDDAWRSSLIASAWKNLCVSGILEDRTIAVFQAVCFEERSVDDVAQRHDITPNSVYQIKHRVIRRLSSEVTRLMSQLD